MSATTAPSFQDYFNIGRAEAAARRPELTFDEGDVSEFLVAAGAAMSDYLTGYTADRIRVTFLDGATGDDLTLLARDRYNIIRKDAVQSTGTVQFVRSGVALPGTIPAGTILATEKDTVGNDVQFSTDIDLNFANGELGPKSVTVTAVNAGKSGNVGVGTVTSIVSTLFDSNFEVTNAARCVGGDEEESDDDLKERVRLFPVTVRRGTLAALEYGALTVAAVKKATAVENDPAPGTVTVYVTDANGGSSPTMVSAVNAELPNWRAAAVQVLAAGGSLVSTNFTLTLTVRAGVDVNSIRQNIIDAVTARVNKLRIGESIPASSDIIRAAVLSVDPIGILSVSVSPSGVAASASQIIRAGTVTVS